MSRNRNRNQPREPAQKPPITHEKSAPLEQTGEREIVQQADAPAPAATTDAGGEAAIAIADDGVRVVMAEIPIARTSHFYPKRDLKLEFSQARVLARIAAGLIADGQCIEKTVKTADGTETLRRPIERLEDVVEWLCNKLMI